MEYCGEYEVHPVASLFPMMSDSELDALAEDIKINGQRVRITLARDTPGDGYGHRVVVVDGRNRYQACLRAGVKPCFEKDYSIAPDEVGAWIISHNLHRRHLTKSQSACVAVSYEEVLAVEAKKRMLAGKADPGKLISQGTEGRAPKASDQAAELFGVSGMSVRDAKYIYNNDRDLFDQVRSGKGSVSGVAKKLREDSGSKPVLTTEDIAIKEVSKIVNKGEEFAKAVLLHLTNAMKES